MDEPVAPSVAYEQLGASYDVWCESVTEDIAFYRAACAGVDGRIVELGVGSGRIAVELCREGHEVVGVDGSPAMLELARARADAAGVGALLTLLPGDLRAPPAVGPAVRVLAPFRPFMHLLHDDERIAALEASRALLTPSGQLVFDVFEPTRADIAETHGRWLEREDGIWERAFWDRDARRIALQVRTRGQTVEMLLEWRSAREWRELIERAGLRVLSAFSGFAGEPLHGRPGDHVFVCGLARATPRR